MLTMLLRQQCKLVHRTRVLLAFRHSSNFCEMLRRSAAESEKQLFDSVVDQCQNKHGIPQEDVEKVFPLIFSKISSLNRGQIDVRIGGFGTFASLAIHKQTEKGEEGEKVENKINSSEDSEKQDIDYNASMENLDFESNIVARLPPKSPRGRKQKTEDVVATEYRTKFIFD